MVSYEEIIFSFVAFIGSAGIIGASLTYYFDKRKQIEFRMQTYKETRYLAIISLMKTVLKPSDFKYVYLHRPDLKSMEDLKNEIETEWYNSFMFASDEVIRTMKAFIKTPTALTYGKVLLAIGKDMWKKKTEFKAEEIKL